MPITNATTATALRGAAYGGVIKEDVLQEIYNLSPIDVPFQDLAGEEMDTNPRKEWIVNALNAVKLDNAVLDGADLSSAAAVGKTGNRVGNFHQIAIRVLSVSDRAQDTTQHGRSDELLYQIMDRQYDLKRDMEAILSWDQPSLAESGSTPGTLGAIGSWFDTTNVTGRVANAIFVSSAGTPGCVGFNTTTGVTTRPTYGTTPGALTETAIRNAAQAAYSNGGDPKFLMSTPTVIRALSTYLFTTSARVATLQTNANPSDVKRVRGQRDDVHQGATAIGSVNVFSSDFGTLTFLPNRFQPLQGATQTNGAAAYLLDPDYLSVGYLHKPRVDPLAKTGLADNRVVSVDFTLVNKNPDAHAAIFGIDPAAAVTT